MSMCHFAGTTTVITGNRVRRCMSSSDNRRREVTEQMWYAAEDCFISVRTAATGNARSPRKR